MLGLMFFMFPASVLAGFFSLSIKNELDRNTDRLQGQFASEIPFELFFVTHSRRIHWFLVSD